MFERDSITQWDKDTFNYSCRNTFRNLAEFVSLHYALSERDDTKYWNEIINREYDTGIHELLPTQNHGFRDHMVDKIYNFRFSELGGIGCISVGYGYLPLTDNTLRHGNKLEEFEYTPYMVSIKALDDRKKAWNDAVKDSPTLYEYLKKNIYDQ